MIFLSLLILIVAIALPSINKNISSISYIRICSIIFIYSGALILNALFIQSIGSGIGMYSDLFHVTVISQLLDTIIFKISSLILISWPKLDENLDKIEEIKTQISKNSIISFDFDLQNFLDSLSKEELLAFSGLLLNSLVLSYVVSIILVLYGDYLIKRFDLENKYPKLAKFIQLRRKLQNYYLKVCFVWIFIGILPQIFVYASIIFPKLLELFS